MARNGSGTYSLPAGNPVVTGTTIQSTWANNTLSDIATALTQSLSQDGQTPVTANLPMGGFKLTGLGAGTTAGDSVRYEQFASPPAIGNTAPNTGAFTTLNTTGNFSVNTSKMTVDATTGNTVIAGTLTIGGVAEVPFPSGTRMLFQQTTAPTGWTKDTTAALNDTALRIVTGTVGSGGSNAFSSATVTATGTIGGSTDGHALSVAELASHTHVEQTGQTPPGTTAYTFTSIFGNGVTINTIADTSWSPGYGNGAQTPLLTQATGSGTAHSHTLAAATFSGNAISLNLKYNDVIIASKN